VLKSDVLPGKSMRYRIRQVVTGFAVVDSVLVVYDDVLVRSSFGGWAFRGALTC
jgi:hypothetical protein